MHPACRKQKVSELFFTMWGDNGAYCNYDSSLAGIIYCADLAYGVPANDPDKFTSKRFAAVCQSSYEAHLVASKIEAADEYGCNPALMIWDDPLLGVLFDDCRRRNPEFDLELSDRYDEMLRKLLPYQEECFAGDFEHIINALQLLLLKLELRGALEAAYDRDDPDRAAPDRGVADPVGHRGRLGVRRLVPPPVDADRQAVRARSHPGPQRGSGRAARGDGAADPRISRRNRRLDRRARCEALSG